MSAISQQTPVPEVPKRPRFFSRATEKYRSLNPTENPSRFSTLTTTLILLSLTAVAAFIRFYKLSQPCLWGDEALVYWRICGTYAQMLVPLRNDGFGPLHYELNWLIAHFFKPTPVVIRLAPTISGILTVPAIFFLARQLFTRATSLLAATIAACSAFLIVYSRDAKMYSEAWFFITLSVGCLLWWLRTGRWTAWLGWIAAAAAAGGIHASSLVLVGISPLFLLTQGKFHFRQSLFWLLGVTIILSGPLGYYYKFNQFLNNVEDDGWGRTGIQWVDWYTRGRTGPDLVRFTSTFMLMGWDWPRETTAAKLPGDLYDTPWLCAMILGIALVIAVLPWPRRLRDRSVYEHSPQPPWRILLWLCFWIVLPAYVFYCHSISGFTGPRHWLPDFTNGWSIAALAIFLIATMVSLAFSHTRAVGMQTIKKLIVVIVIFLFCHLIFSVCDSMAIDAANQGKSWHSIWVPRYLGFIFPALCVAAAAMILRLPTRPMRVAITIFFLSVNLWFGFNRFLGKTEPPFDLMAKDAMAAQGEATRTYTESHMMRGPFIDISLDSLVGHYYLQMEMWKQPMSPDEFRRPPSYRSWHNYTTQSIVADVQKNPQLNHIIIWDDYPANISNLIDPLAPKLKTWKLESETWFPQNDFWNAWMPKGSIVRREYIKQS